MQETNISRYDFNDSRASSIRVTPLGEAWVKALLQVPAPQPAFVDQNGVILT